MSEETVIENTKNPNTISTLVRDFKNLGIKPGMTLLVHSSLSSIGWVCGGAVSVIQALEEVLTGEGTLVMPAHSCSLSDPSHWQFPPVPEFWWQTIKDEMPVFDKDLTPTQGMGAIAETFRKQSGVVRSSHPQCSFAAWGKNKDYVIQDSHYDFAQNDKSPLGRIYELDGYVLMIGTSYEENTSLHLAEYRSSYKGKVNVKDGFAVIKDGKRTWLETEDILYRDDDFEQIGSDFEIQGNVTVSKVGNAECHLMSQRKLVDFATNWMNENRSF